MKKLLLTLVCLMALAAPSFAQVEEDPTIAPSSGNGRTQEDLHRRRPRGGDELPVAPVPEPGTMALASMGLIALGAAARRQRGK